MTAQVETTLRGPDAYALAHRVVDAMQAASPAYLECLLTYLEVLVALEPMVSATLSSAAVATSRRAPRVRKRRD